MRLPFLLQKIRTAPALSPSSPERLVAANEGGDTGKWIAKILPQMRLPFSPRPEVRKAALYKESLRRQGKWQGSVHMRRQSERNCPLFARRSVMQGPIRSQGCAIGRAQERP